MENQPATNRIHPLIAGAAVSVILVSLVGVAAITGVLPISHGAGAPAATLSPPTVQESNNGSNGRNAELLPQASPSSSAQYSYLPQTQVAQGAPAAQAIQYQEPVQSQPAQAQPICKNCGKVESVRIVQHHARPSGVGMVAGAVLGGVLGNQVGAGNGRSLATVAGAVGGGYAGNEVEKRSHTVVSYQVRVRMQDGRVRHFSYAAQPGWRAGDPVKVVHGRLTARG